MSKVDPHDLGLVKPFEEWKRAIGDFMVSFNTCEYWVYRYISELVPPNLAAFLSEERLKKRSAAAWAAIKDSGLDISDTKVSELFARLEKLSNYRNILAHNAPAINVHAFPDGETETRSAPLNVEASRAPAENAG